MAHIVPNIWCNGNAQEVGDFYAGIFPRTTSEVESRYPNQGLLDFQQPLAGEPLTVAVDVNGTKITLVNADDNFRPNPAISFTANFHPAFFGGDPGQTQTALDQAWQRLSKGGQVMMELDEYEFSPRYGWVEDRYGVSWQLTLVDQGETVPQFLTPCLMFCGPAQNHATEAADFYVATFSDSKPGQRFHYPEANPPVTTESVMYSDFTLKGQMFSAMDSGVEMVFTFTPGVSLEVACRDQSEIDALWEALSAVPEAEQCGWLTDRFGVSWQIVPQNMGELMQRTGAFEKLMGMKKIVIDEF